MDSQYNSAGSQPISATPRERVIERLTEQVESFSNVVRSGAWLLNILLEKIRKTRSYVVIIEISGVPSITPEVASVFKKAEQAIRLMGGRYIIGGIHAKIAASVVNRGIDISDITYGRDSFSTLKFCSTLVGLKAATC